MRELYCKYFHNVLKSYTLGIKFYITNNNTKIYYDLESNSFYYMDGNKHIQIDDIGIMYENIKKYVYKEIKNSQENFIASKLEGYFELTEFQKTTYKTLSNMFEEYLLDEPICIYDFLPFWNLIGLIFEFKDSKGKTINIEKIISLLFLHNPYFNLSKCFFPTMYMEFFENQIESDTLINRLSSNWYVKVSYSVDGGIQSFSLTPKFMTSLKKACYLHWTWE